MAASNEDIFRAYTESSTLKNAVDRLVSEKVDTLLSEKVDSLVSEKIEEMKQSGALKRHGRTGAAEREGREAGSMSLGLAAHLVKRLTHMGQTHVHFVFHKLVHKSFHSGNFFVDSATIGWPSPASTDKITILIDDKLCEVWRPDWSDFET